jgi:uncharacterized protein
MTARSRHVCPICGKESRSRAENPSYPFCSPPCKLVDLGAWLDGAYRIPGQDVVLDGDHDDASVDQDAGRAWPDPRHEEET